MLFVMLWFVDGSLVAYNVTLDPFNDPRLVKLSTFELHPNSEQLEYVDYERRQMLEPEAMIIHSNYYLARKEQNG